MNEQPIKSIDCQSLYQVSLRGPIKLIDVRTPEEFAEAHASMAENLPLSSFDPTSIAKAHASSSEPIYFICAVGGRSAWACETMMAAGYENVVNVEGGTQAWYLAGLPIEQGP
jgi:rhodanese-related sulfurtransferase